MNVLRSPSKTLKGTTNPLYLIVIEAASSRYAESYISLMLHVRLSPTTGVSIKRFNQFWALFSPQQLRVWHLEPPSEHEPTQNSREHQLEFCVIHEEPLSVQKSLLNLQQMHLLFCLDGPSLAKEFALYLLCSLEYCPYFLFIFRAFAQLLVLYSYWRQRKDATCCTSTI